MSKRACDRCASTKRVLRTARAKIAVLERTVVELQAECAELHEQLAEALKEAELQRADLLRYEKAYESARPNHPERTPRAAPARVR